MNFKGVKTFSLSVLAGVLVGIILKLFIPGIPKICEMVFLLVIDKVGEERILCL